MRLYYVLPKGVYEIELNINGKKYKIINKKEV